MPVYRDGNNPCNTIRVGICGFEPRHLLVGSVDDTISKSLAEDCGTGIFPREKPFTRHRLLLYYWLTYSQGGVLERPGHTEAAVDLMHLAGLKPYGVLCELTNTRASKTALRHYPVFGHGS